MLADASISRADVSKAKPSAPDRPSGHTHGGRQPQRGADKWRRRWRRRDVRAAWAQPPRSDQGQGGSKSGRGAASGRGDARRWGRTSVRPSSPAEGGIAERMSGRSGVAHRRIGARRGRARRGEAATTTAGEERRFGGKRLCADLEGDGAYIEPPTFCHRSYLQPWQKALRIKTPLLSQVASQPVTKGAFRAGCPEGEFSPFTPGWCYHPWQKGGL
jgi:hypothetical protein